MKPQFFYTEAFINNIATIEQIAYRAEDREARKKAKMETTYLDFVSHFILAFEANVEEPSKTIYHLRQASEKYYYSASKTTDKKVIIQHLAEKARIELNVKNNKELLYKLEMSGISILEKNMGAEIDAYSVWTKENRPLIILGNRKKSSV